MPLHITVKQKHISVFVVTLAGSVDSETYIELENTINPLLVSATKVIVLDMGKVDYVSSMGLRTIFKTREMLEQNSGALILVNLQPQIEKVLSVLKATPDLDIFGTMEEADEYLAKLQKKWLKKK
jgi:anti-anti-sigma factor